MLPKINRLPLRFTRSRLNEMGTTIHSPLLTAIVAKSEKPQPSRFAVILSKKISNKAVVRNKFRRRILNSLHPLLPGLKQGFDVLLLTKKTILEADSSQIQSDLKKILENADLL